MKKFMIVAILFLTTQAFSPDVNSGNNLLSDFLDGRTEEKEPKPPTGTRAPLQGTLRFRIALIACYTALASIFGSIIYYAVLLDPKFPF